MKKMKKMKKQFLSLFVLLCMIISMFPTTALAANIIDVSGNVTITRSDEELTCADNLYYGEVNVNGSATESKTRLTHPVLPLIQWQYGNNTYQIIPSAYKYYVYNINDPNHILEGIEGSEGSSTLSGWPGTYKCYQTVVTTDGVTNGTATFDIDLIYQFSRLNSSIGWTYASNWGGRTLHFTIKQTVAYTVTYTDGVEDEEVFADEVHENLSSGVATPAFSGGTPTRTGYVFKGWNPEVAATVTGNATYVATWGEDKNNNGIDDNEETKYTVTYKDGVDGEVFADQVYGNLLSGVATPAFEGTPTREGYVFKGWNPAVAATVTGNATYVATWGEDKNNNGIDDNEETKYTVTYKDGVDGEVFADQVYGNLLSGVATPAFEGTPTREEYVFKGWEPAVAEKVTGDATYAATWGEDKNNNGIDDNEETKYTVTYTDGVDGEVFADQVYGNLLSGVATPAFEGTPTREGYVFKGWKPAVAEKVTGDVTYVATWGEDKNNNGIADDEETKYTVRYTDGVDEEVIFADQVYGNLLSGVDTPAFKGTPTREGYVFKGWKPAVAEKVTGDVTYVAVWEKAKDNNGDTKPGDTKPGDTKPGNTKPGNTKPGNTKPNTTTNSSTKAGTSARSPKTSDTANLALWMALLVVSGGSMVINKKKKYNR